MISERRIPDSTRFYAVAVFLCIAAGLFVTARPLLPFALIGGAAAVVAAALRPEYVTVAWFLVVPLAGPTHFKVAGIPEMTAPRALALLGLISTVCALANGYRTGMHRAAIAALAFIAATFIAYEFQAVHEPGVPAAYISTIVVSFGAALPLLLAPIRVDLCLRALKVTGLALALLAIREHQTLHNQWQATGGADPIYRAQGPFEHPLVLAAFLSAAALVFLDQMLSETTPARRWIAGICLAIVGWGLYVTYSRGPLIGLAAGGVFLLIRARKRARLELALVVAGLAYAINAGTSNTAAISRLGSGETVRLRLSLYNSAWELFKQHPFFGLGVRGFGHALGSQIPSALANQNWAAVDNYYLLVLVEGGLFAALAFAFLVVLAIRWTLASDRGDPRHRLGGALVVAVLVTALGFDLFSYPALAVLFFLGVRMTWPTAAIEYAAAETH